MTFYERYCLPRLLDLACGVRPVRRQRNRVVPLACGEVLEVGIGTGLNLPHYRAEQIKRIWALDPATQMNRTTRKRLCGTGLDLELLALSAERIPVENDRFDTVVLTYTLCSIPDPVVALREMKRTLRPGGRLLFCEHGLAPQPSIARWQRRLTPAWRRIAGDCHMDRDVPALLDAAGFKVDVLQQGYIPGPRVLTYNYWGEAV